MNRRLSCGVAIAGALVALALAGCPEGPGCADGLMIGDETDIDCGGGCGPCAAGKSCSADEDCASGLCADGICRLAPGCSDGMPDGEESDVDCGGGCAPCAAGLLCKAPGDCASGLCEGGRCLAPPGCSNGLRDGDETDVDCGGSCDRCAEGRRCGSAADCASGNCELGACQPVPTCSDMRKNGDESDLDCGGSCPGCPEYLSCRGGEDCALGICDEGLCFAGGGTCTNGVKDGEESDIDCGGRACPRCASGFFCVDAGDCFDGLCINGVCNLDVCYDGIQNGKETDIDCGGGACDPCPEGFVCESDEDCLSNVCDGHGQCTAPPESCLNGVLDGDEVDVDCGGGLCPKCQNGYYCEQPSDCLWGVCQEGMCGYRGLLCSNGQQDAHETDSDCGGRCPKCAGGMRCLIDDDCLTGECLEDGTCSRYGPGCFNGQQDANETDRDCGGECPPCAETLACREDRDCATLSCQSNACGPDIVSLQSSPESVGCSTAGTVTVRQGIVLKNVMVASPRFEIDADTDGYYLGLAGEQQRERGAPYSGILAAVAKSLGTDFVVGSIVTARGDYQERDCESVFSIPATGSIAASGRPDRSPAASIPASVLENGGGADAEAYEGVYVFIGDVAVTDTTGFSGPESEGAPDWWFKAGTDIYVANDFGLTETPPQGSSLQWLMGMVKYHYGVYEVVPREPGDLAVR